MIRTGKYKKPMDGWCRVCDEYHVKIPYFDLDLNGAICSKCYPFVGVAEICLKANGLYTPDDYLISKNP